MKVHEAASRPEPVVRYATPEDYPHIIEMSEDLHRENGHQAIDYSVAEAAIMDAINGNRALIGVIGPARALEGIVFLRFASFWYTNEVMLEEIFCFVPPEYRKTGNAKALLTFAKAAADRLKLPLMIGVLSSHRTKAKLKLYAKHFGEPAGGYFFLYPRPKEGRKDDTG